MANYDVGPLPMKRCPKCGQDKTHEEFSKDIRKTNGLGSYCKECKAAYSRAYHKAHLDICHERIRAYAKSHSEERHQYNRAYNESHKDAKHEYRIAYYATHRDAALQYARTHNENHRDEVREYNRNYHITHRDERKEYGRIYNLTHRDENRQYCRIYRETHSDAMREYYRIYREMHLELVKERDHIYRTTHPEQIRAKSIRQRVQKANAFGADYTTLTMIEARCEYYGHLCYICGNPMEVVDHVKPLAKGGAHLPCNLRPACRQCNTAKGAKWPIDIIGKNSKEEIIDGTRNLFWPLG